MISQEKMRSAAHWLCEALEQREFLSATALQPPSAIIEAPALAVHAAVQARPNLAGTYTGKAWINYPWTGYQPFTIVVKKVGTAYSATVNTKGLPRNMTFPIPAPRSSGLFTQRLSRRGMVVQITGNVSSDYRRLYAEFHLTSGSNELDGSFSLKKR